jgi:hypothetical protein
MVDSVSVFSVGPPDSLALPVPEVGSDASSSNGERKRVPGRHREITPPESSSTESVPTELPSVSVALPEEERLQLRSAALADITAADIALSGLGPRALTEEEKQTVETIRGLMDQARHALSGEDIQAAADLARKARLLADKLPKPAPR